VNAVVSATTSPHYILTQEAYRRMLPEGNSRLLVDLVVPYDIDRALLDVDYFDVLARENRSVKLDELQKAQQIVQDCVEEAVKKTAVRKFQAPVGAARTEPWFPKMIFYLKDVLDSAQLQQVLKRIADTEAEDA
jgi:glutamyl-tRNA reductase